MRANHLSANHVQSDARPWSATRIASSVVGIYGGLLGAAHGYFEIRQGAVLTDGVAINAIGAPCQPETVAHACWPAMTLVRNLQTSGTLVLIVSLAALVWALFFITRERRRPVLFGLAILMLLFGGGFLPPIYVMIAAVSATQIDVTGRWWRVRLSEGMLRLLATLWPLAFVVYFVWVAIQTLFGDALNAFLLGIGPGLIPVELAVLVLSIISAFAYDILRTRAARHSR